METQRSRRSSTLVQYVLVAACLAPTLPGARAQTSGSLTPVATTYNYSTAPWLITAGTGAYPDSGGIATFNAVTSSTPGTILTGTTITVDVSPDLSQINYNSPFSYTLAAGTGTSLVADAAGLTLNAANTVVNSPTSVVSTTFNNISAPISGGGTSGVTKTGSGIVTLSGANTYTGGTHINGGLLIVAGTAANGDAVFGATGAGNDLSINGGTLFTNVTGGLTTARNITLGANGGTIETDTAFTVNGVVSGTGALSVSAFGTAAVTLTNANTYTGATVTSLSATSALTLSGNGSIVTSNSYDLSGTLTLDNSGTTGVNRLSDTATLTSRGALITTTGNANTASSETFGGLTLASGLTEINVIPGTAGSTLTTSGITRQNGSTLFVRGTNLGAAPGAGNSTILSTTAPTLIGGGGVAGSTTISVVPWALGNLLATTGNNVTVDISSTQVTYNPIAGFRPLAASEYAATLGANATDNVRLTASTAAAAGVTANALLFAPSITGQSLTGGPINVTSGSVIYSPTATTGSLVVVGIPGTIGAGLNFGAAEGVIQYTAPLTLSGVIAGNGGLTLSSPNAQVVTISGANTYTGTTTIVDGQTSFTGAVANDGVTAGPFGLSTTPVVLNAGAGLVRLAATANTTFNRNLLVAGTGSPGLDYFGGTSGLTMNGNVDLEHNLIIYAGSTTATGVVVNGTISGPGGLQGFSNANVTLNGNNTFSGGVNALGDTYTLGSDTAFGTGTVYTSAASTFQGSGTQARTIANNFVTLATPTFAGTAALNLTGGFNLDGSRTIAVTNTAGTTFSGVLSNGAVTTTGTGTVAFNSPTGNTYTGGFVNTGAAANASTIYANNSSGSAFGTGAVSIGAASATVFSTLAGTFATSGATSIGGRLSPGNGPGLTAATAGIGSIGTETFNTTLTLSSVTTSSLYLEVAGNNNSDQIIVGGTFTLNGTVFIATEGGYTIQNGDSFTLATAGSITQGTYTFNTTNATLAPGVTLTETVTGTQILVNAVPEPGTYALLALGSALAVAGFVGRRCMRA